MSQAFIQRLRPLLVLAICWFQLLPAARGQQIGWQAAVGFGSFDRIRGEQDSYSKAVTDASGNTYVMGNCVAFLSVGRFSFVPSGAVAGFIAKFDVNHVPQWLRSVNGSSGFQGDWFTDMCLDPSGRLYATGGYMPGASLDDGVTVLPDYGSFLAVYDAQGNLLQTEILSRGATANPVAGAGYVSANGPGSCFISGAARQTTTFGGAPVTLPANNTLSQSFVASYSLVQHTTTWLQVNVLTQQADVPQVLAANNHCYLVSTYQGTGVLFGTTLPPAPHFYNGGAYAACLDSAGNVIWLQRFSVDTGAQALSPRLMRPALTGNELAVIGVSDNSLQFFPSGQTLPALGGGQNPFWVRFNLQTGAARLLPLTATVPTGVFGGVGVFPGSGPAARLAPDGLYWGGTYAGTVDFGSVVGSRTCSNSFGDAFVARFDTMGVCQWLVTSTGPSAGGFAPTGVRDLAVLGADQVRVAGEFDGATQFGNIQLVPAGDTDMFVATIGIVTGLPKETDDDELHLFPNPARGAVQLRLARPVAAPQAVAVLDGLGRVVRTAAMPAGARLCTLDVDGLPVGLYLVRCGQVVRRLVIE